jgi:rubrerythrin
MIGFHDPYNEMVHHRKMNHRELTRDLQSALSAENEAVRLYQVLADSSTTQEARLVLRQTAYKALLHVREDQLLLNMLGSLKKTGPHRDMQGSTL